MNKTVLIFIITLSIGMYGLLLTDGVNTLQLARVFGLMGLSLVIWQVVLGFRGTAKLFTRDLISLNGVHRFLGTYGFLLLVTHYVLILASDSYDLKLILSTDLTNPTVLYIKYGLIAFYSALTIWLTSALLRTKLSWDWWKNIHFLAYVVIGFALLHSGNIGTTIQTNDLVRGWWYVQVAVFVIIVVWRFAGWIGLAKKAYLVEAIEDVASDVKQFTLVPKNRSLSIHPSKGQFAYFQYDRFKRAHPFTVSHYSEDTGSISFSIKKVGDYTTKLHENVQRGDEVFVDGPYGVFTSDIEQSSRKSVLIAGGIGITPFLRHVGSKRLEHLFWGARTTTDLAYIRDLIRSKTNLTVVLSEEDRKGYESGYVTPELLKNKLGGMLADYDFYICGPPPMMNAVYKQLLEAKVPSTQIYTERFSL